MSRHRSRPEVADYRETARYVEREVEVQVHVPDLSKRRLRRLVWHASDVAQDNTRELWIRRDTKGWNRTSLAGVSNQQDPGLKMVAERAGKYILLSIDEAINHE